MLKRIPNDVAYFYTRYMLGLGAMNNLIRDLSIVTKNSLPFKLIGERSSVSIKDVGFDTGLMKKVVTYAELYSNRDIKYWSPEKAITRAKDEVLAALVEINRSRDKGISLDEYISLYKQKTVLLLGDYDESGLQRLQVIADVLRSLDYEPLVIKDIPDHPHQDISQKVIAVGAIARFIIVDDSSKSGHLTEIEICKKK